MIRYKLHSYPGHPEKLASEYQPDMRPHDKRKYKLMREYAVIVVSPTAGILEMCVPKGFISDGASVPRAVWTSSGLTPDGLLRAAALIHDWLYRYKGKVNLYTQELYGVYKEDEYITKRVDADKIFYDLMRAAGVSFYRANIAYYAVRWFAPRWK